MLPGRYRRGGSSQEELHTFGEKHLQQMRSHHQIRALHGQHQSRPRIGGQDYRTYRKRIYEQDLFDQIAQGVSSGVS